jgi:hypothetical protein
MVVAEAGPRPAPTLRRIGRYARFRADVARRDAVARARYGSAAPRYAERIWIDPAACERAVEHPGFVNSGEVRGGDWDQRLVDVESIDRIRFCRLHFVEGLSWEETGAIEAMARRVEDRDERLTVDGCATLEDVEARYRRLDETFERCRREGRLLRREELPGRPFRENYGVVVHISRDGEPLFSWHGCHRLAIARILELPEMPAQVGVVHPDALPTWRGTFRAER